MSKVQSSALLTEKAAWGGGCNRTLLRVPPTNLVCSSYLRISHWLIVAGEYVCQQIESWLHHNNLVPWLYKSCDGTKNRLGAPGMDRDIVRWI